MDGVWIEPVTAHVAITFRDVAIRSFNDVQRPPATSMIAPWT